MPGEFGIPAEEKSQGANRISHWKCYGMLR